MVIEERAGKDGGEEALASAEDEDAAARALRVEVTRLFVGERGPTCPPYEGVWRALDEGVTPLLFVNSHSMAVERFCKACGLGQPEGTNIPLDHAVSECELLQYLAMLEAGMVEPVGGVLPSDLPGGAPAAAYGEFYESHAIVWLPRFAERLFDETRHPAYRAIALLMAALTKGLSAK